MVTNFQLRVYCSEQSTLAHLPQDFLWQRAVSVEPEPKCSKTPPGTKPTLIPLGSESQSQSPHACDSELLGHPSYGWDPGPAWALPAGHSDSGWCAQVPGQQLSEIMWPLKGTLGDLTLTAGSSQPAFSHCIWHSRGGASFRLLGVAADWDKPMLAALK